MSSFVHLHTHSEYSLLDGANRLGDLITRAQEYEMPAVALTDHGTMYGAWQFRQQATKAGIKPIVGMEAYVAPGDRRERRPGPGDRNYYHLVLLARDLEGYRNLVRLSSIGFLEGFYHKPRIDREVLKAHSEGIIVSSACMAGEVARHLMDDQDDAAREAAEWYAETFHGRYYLEVQAHDTPGQAELNRKIFGLADEMGLPLVATNDAHFLRPDDHDAHDVLLCIGLGRDREDENRMKYDGGLYFKSADEIAARFPDRPEVLENTLDIADQVSLDLPSKYYVPEFPLPGEFSDEASFLKHLATEGTKERYGDPLPPEVQERLDYELSVIANPKADYSGYFLITADFIVWAKENGIPVGPGRGSAAGSIVAYALGITDVDPLEFDLLFERFLNPDRVSMPDIDIDFCYERRGRVIEYVREKYGRDSVGQIITFGTMKSRAVIRDVGRVLGLEPSETDRLAKLIPNAPGSAMTVAQAAEEIGELRELIASDARIARLVEYAQVLEGLSRHASVHAAGVVIAPGPLQEYVPVCVQSGGRGSGANGDEDTIVTQWDMNALEQAGMLKMDFLGLKTLTVIHDAVEAVRARHGALRHPVSGEEYERVEDVPRDDPAVYEMLAHGGTSGVFQFESSLATEKLRTMRADRFEDLVATNALIRPGPLDSGMTDVYIRRKLGKEPVRYPHPKLEQVLEPTYGVITYQEQVMRIAQVLAGFTLAEADVMRKAVGKKDAALIGQQIEKFTSQAMERGVDAKTAKEIAEQIETFGRYGFNRSHSVAYALLSYQTAWLKRHYPAEFMAALLSSVVDKTDDVVKYIAECRDIARHIPDLDDGIEVLPPDVNESGWKFTAVSERAIRFGMGACRGVGEGAVRSILAAREEAPFETLFDFADRIDLRAAGKRTLEALIAAGACDSFGHRAQLMAGLEKAVGEAQLRQADRVSGQGSLFDVGGEEAPVREAPTLPEVPRWPESDRLAREKEILGFFISGHPLDKFRDELRLFSTVNTANLPEHRDRKVELACVVTSVSRQISKRSGQEWGRITVEDFHGTASVLAFGESWEEYRDTLTQDSAVLIRGQVSGRDRDEDDPPIFLDEAMPLATIRTAGSVGLELRLLPGENEDRIEAATAAFRKSPGDAPLFVVLDDAGHRNGNGAAEVAEIPDGSGIATNDNGSNGHGSNGHGSNGHGGGHGTGGPRRFRSRSVTVSASAELLDELRELFGPERVRLVRAKG
ncbi:MAG TPA: DNA polymerase III subunit alpha [Longimicrobiales bacterium]|nr:DNA polymerase III subunit alpha [Longimicrobiales bacterium]